MVCFYPQLRRQQNGCLESIAKSYRHKQSQIAGFFKVNDKVHIFVWGRLCVFLINNEHLWPGFFLYLLDLWSSPTWQSQKVFSHQKVTLLEPKRLKQEGKGEKKKKPQMSWLNESNLLEWYQRHTRETPRTRFASNSGVQMDYQFNRSSSGNIKASGRGRNISSANSNFWETHLFRMGNPKWRNKYMWRFFFFFYFFVCLFCFPKYYNGPNCSSYVIPLTDKKKCLDQESNIQERSKSPVGTRNLGLKDKTLDYLSG